MDKALDWDSGELGSVCDDTTDSLNDRGQVTRGLIVRRTEHPQLQMKAMGAVNAQHF